MAKVYFTFKDIITSIAKIVVFDSNLQKDYNIKSNRINDLFTTKLSYIRRE